MPRVPPATELSANGLVRFSARDQAVPGRARRRGKDARHLVGGSLPHERDPRPPGWLDLLQDGLRKASFLPSTPQRELRELIRSRTYSGEGRAREVNRRQKTLEDTKLKLGEVVSDMMGKASQLILQAVVNRGTDPTRLAAFAVGRVRASQQELESALTFPVKAHHRFMRGEHLKQIETLNAAMGRVSQEMARHFPPPDDPETAETAEPESTSASPETAAHEDANRQPSSKQVRWQKAAQIIDEIIGISEEAAQGILAESGIQMEPFPSAQHLAS